MLLRLNARLCSSFIVQSLAVVQVFIHRCMLCQGQICKSREHFQHPAKIISVHLLIEAKEPYQLCKGYKGCLEGILCSKLDDGGRYP